ncbi:cupin domain-containing protein [Actinoplanes sp. NEAU-A12]|uniref:Cupin domain-containing protein n=1 Tax=Actinoplanes sandaracinus TaxID=3045177 RepID=A0ABT6WX50_9ACTN|nr:cupin domain-containing protein [Actinoplanes sandaracinus]MDI6104309.1 cupin domain-containing protein [Actinoplanes sandaracinus]
MTAGEPIQLSTHMWMRTLVDLGTLSLDYLEIQPGSIRTPVVHDNCDELSYILSGELEFHLGDQKRVMRAGEAIGVPRGVPHGSVNHGPEVVRMLAANSPAFRLEDEVELQPEEEA